MPSDLVIDALTTYQQHRDQAADLLASLTAPCDCDGDCGCLTPAQAQAAADTHAALAGHALTAAQLLANLS